MNNNFSDLILVATDIREWSRIKELVFENNISIISDFPKNESFIFFIFDCDKNHIRFLKSKFGFLSSDTLRGLNFNLASSAQFANMLIEMKFKDCKFKMTDLAIPHDKC